MKVSPSGDILAFLSKDFDKAVPKDRRGAEGALIFEKEDVLKYSDRLVRMLRYIFWKEGITVQYLKEKNREYCVNVLGFLPSQIHTKFSNLMKVVLRDSITILKFDEIFVDILGYKSNLSVELSIEGNSFDVNYYDIVTELS